MEFLRPAAWPEALAIKADQPSAVPLAGGTDLMAEIQVRDGQVRNSSLTDYVIPTILDTPSRTVDVIERAGPNAPSGARGVGEPPTISATPAIVAAIRQVTGLALLHASVRPDNIVRG